MISGNGWDISLGNVHYNNAADFAYGNQGARWWGGSIGWGVLPFNTWTHLAISRSQGRLYTHKNGVLVSTVAIPANANMEAGAATSALMIGQSASYLDDVMITIGSAKYTTANFALAQLARPTLYLPMDGAHLSTSFPNYGSGAALTTVSSPTITTTQAVRGGASANLTTGSLTTPTSSAYLLGAQDFTIEFWVNFSTRAGDFSPVVAGNGWDITVGNTRYNNGADFAYGNQDARWWGGSIGWGVLPLNTWVHLSLSRSGTRLYTHKNGVLVSMLTIPATDRMEGPTATTSAISIGTHPAYVDDLLVTIGRARHTTANFPVSY
ncbi:LamG-like jellyroll fold domain-containing protein [Archangium gephyra]|uniref:LamG-like jellyroll fold domain-containing protein n=1 Tax=Archangium gephyra TaxID=48 RepID=UPI003B79F846